MGHEIVGTKQAQLRELGKNKRERLNQIVGKKPSTSDLRGKIAKIKTVKPQRGGGRGR